MPTSKVRKCTRLPDGKGLICRKRGLQEGEAIAEEQESPAEPAGAPGPDVMAKKLLQDVESWRRRRRAT